MDTQPITPTTKTIAGQTAEYEPIWPALCWKAIFGGTIAAIGIHILLSMLGVGAGLAVFSPTTDSDSMKHFDVGAAVIWSVCALVSLFFGGLLAGRFSRSPHAGFVHGVLVWSLTLIITLLLVSVGTGMVLGGGLKLISQGLGVAGQATASGLGDVAKEGVKRTGDELKSFIDEAKQSTQANGKNGTNATSTDANAGATGTSAAISSQRDIGFAVTKLFAPENDIDSGDNRTAVIKALTASGQVNEADATTMVNGWITSYKNVKSELDHAKQVAEQKAKEAADEAARVVACAAIWSFFALLVGLVVTALAGSFGGKHAARFAAERMVTTDGTRTDVIRPQV